MKNNQEQIEIKSNNLNGQDDNNLTEVILETKNDEVQDTNNEEVQETNNDDVEPVPPVSEEKVPFKAHQKSQDSLFKVQKVEDSVQKLPDR